MDDKLTLMLHLCAEFLRNAGADDAVKELHEAANLISTLGGLRGLSMTARTLDGPLPTKARCPVADCEGTIQVTGKVCHTSEEGQMGYRTRWRCDKCGHGEIR